MEPLEQYIQAIKNGDVGEVQLLLDDYPHLRRVKLDGDLSPALLAMYYDEPETAQAIIAAGAPLDVFAAAGCGQTALLAALLDERPERANAYAADGFQPLGLAAFFGQAAAVALLLERGAGVNSPSHNPMRVMPLHSAAANRHVDICRLLLQAGAAVNATQADNFTALHAAAQNNDATMARLLLEYGADPYVATLDGVTPLALAEQEDSTDVLVILRAL